MRKSPGINKKNHTFFRSILKILGIFLLSFYLAFHFGNGKKLDHLTQLKKSNELLEKEVFIQKPEAAFYKKKGLKYSKLVKLDSL